MLNFSVLFVLFVHNNLYENWRGFDIFWKNSNYLLLSYTQIELASKTIKSISYSILGEMKKLRVVQNGCPHFRNFGRFIDRFIHSRKVPIYQVARLKLIRCHHYYRKSYPHWITKISFIFCIGDEIFFSFAALPNFLQK